MKSEEFNTYRERFLNGELNALEESELRSFVLEHPNSENMDLQSYFSITNEDQQIGFTPILKKEFFQKIDAKNQNVQRRNYWVVAASICIMTISIFIFSPNQKQSKTISQAEIDQSFEVTKLALNSFSSNIKKGLEKTGKGMDFSRPYKSLTKLKELK